jgi:tetratricopeptide (TPR) repeat protein
MRQSKILILALWTFWSTIGTANEADEEIQASMGEIYTVMQALIVDSLDANSLADIEKRRLFEERLRILNERSVILMNHTGQKEVGFHFHSFALVADIEAALAEVQRERYADSQGIVRNLFANCVGCHSRLPAKDSTKSIELFSQLKIKSLALMEKARLEVALRQFDKALTTYEEILASKRFPWPRDIQSDPFVEYLTLCIRVKNDYPRAIKALNELRSKRTVPHYLNTDLDVWVQSLNQIKNDPKLQISSFDTVRSLMNKAKSIMEFQLDNKGLIYYIQASKILHDLLDSDQLSLNHQAEAYYHLALTEMLTVRGYWLPKAVQYLESAIRLAPKSKIATRAYETLEGHVIIFAYSMDSSAKIPETLAKKLETLRGLITAP